jgi:aspyridone synthetase (hybrid polyketide synthase/nonribosomal peptide synthetase)
LSLGQGPQVESKWPATLSERFDQVCEAFPDAVAIKDDGELLTYRQLGSRVESITVALLKAGVASGDYVVVLCQPGIDMLAALLGILHVGAIYVPLDVTVPTARQMHSEARATDG